MLLELNIKNFAIIENLNVSFRKGLNIITGETGTGKSILIEALGVLLGSRTNKDFIRTGEEKAFLEAVFYIEESLVEKILKEYEIPLDKDKILIINRVIDKNGPSLSKVNGKNVNLSMLSNITRYLVDVFGQHEHQSLLNTHNHRVLLDSFGDYDFNKIKEDVYSKYNCLITERKKLEKISMDNAQREREIDILKYQISEINDSNIDISIDSNIEEKYKFYSQLSDINNTFSSILTNLNDGEYEGINIIDIIRKNIVKLEKIVRLDSKIEKIYERFKNLNFELEDLNRECRSYTENLEYNPRYIFELEDRLNLVNKLKNKYGQTLDDIFEFKNDAEKKLFILENQDEEIFILKEKINSLEQQLKKSSNILTDMRKTIASGLEEKISLELGDLDMNQVKFKVDFKFLEDFSNNGKDKIEFLISTNLGESLKPLSKIASGGEMSRIMLAFKRILAEYDGIETMIFDEIDAGISGRTAQIVGEKIYEISKTHQVLCISHLPQITAMADTHYSINKQIIGDKTGSYIKQLDFKERVEELARLIGGVDLTEITIKHAIQMIEMCDSLKKGIDI